MVVPQAKALDNTPEVKLWKYWVSASIETLMGCWATAIYRDPNELGVTLV
jgi:hypothetical protein